MAIGSTHKGQRGLKLGNFLPPPPASSSGMWEVGGKGIRRSSIMLNGEAWSFPICIRAPVGKVVGSVVLCH